VQRQAQRGKEDTMGKGDIGMWTVGAVWQF
jgi:hypothetical protein